MEIQDHHEGERRSWTIWLTASCKYKITMKVIETWGLSFRGVVGAYC